MYLVERWVNNVTFQLEKRGGRERRERGNRFHNFHRPIFIYIIVLTRESKNSPSYTSTGNRSSPSVFFSFLSLSRNCTDRCTTTNRTWFIIRHRGTADTPRVANTRHCTRLVRRNESLPAALRIYMEPLRNRYGYAQVVLFIRDRVRTFSLGTSQPLLSSYISSRVTPPSRRPTMTELSRVWYGELLLRNCSFFFFPFFFPPFLFRFRFSIQLIAKFW